MVDCDLDDGRSESVRGPDPAGPGSAHGADLVGSESAHGAGLVEELRGALHAELDEVIPHVISALKRHDAVSDLARRLDVAEKQLAERGSRPFVAGVRRVLNTVRRLDFDAAVKGAIVGELERLLTGAGYTEFGEVGEAFDPDRHEVVAGEAEAASAVVVEVFEPGLETLGEVLAPAGVRVGAPAMAVQQ